MSNETTLTMRDSNHNTDAMQQFVHAMSEVGEIGVELALGKYFAASVEVTDAIACLTKLLNTIIEEGNLKATPQEIMDITIKNAEIRRYYE